LLSLYAVARENLSELKAPTGWYIISCHPFEKNQKMKKSIIIILTFTICSVSFGQTRKLFEVNEVLIKDSTQFKTERDFIKRDTAFFEDETYLVRKTCSGEWGGTIWFKNKISGIEYSCEATCPVIVNKLNGKYYVTSTLAHMFGFSEVIEISRPDSMAVFKLPEPVGSPFILQDKTRQFSFGFYYS
jgi:hypothetical protein